MPPWIGAVPAVLLVGGLSLVSLWGLIGRSFRPGLLVGAPLGLDAWRSVMSDGSFWAAVGFTLRTALVATALSVALSIPLGRALQRGTPALRSMMGLQIPVPHLVVGALAIAWIGPAGLVDRLVGVEGLIGSRFGWGVVLVYVVKEVPFLTILVATALDPATSDLEEAVRGLGGNRWDRWRTVILPSIAQPLTVGTVIVAAFVVGATEVPLAVGPLSPDAMTTYGLTLGRLRGPIARADEAVALVSTTVVVAAIASVGFVLLGRFRRVR